MENCEVLSLLKKTLLMGLATCKFSLWKLWFKRLPNKIGVSL